MRNKRRNNFGLTNDLSYVLEKIFIREIHVVAMNQTILLQLLASAFAQGVGLIAKLLSAFEVLN